MNRNTAFKNIILTFSLLLNVALVILVGYLIVGNGLYPSQPDSSDLDSEVLAEQELDSTLPTSASEPLELTQPSEAVVSIATSETQQSTTVTTATTVRQKNTTTRLATTTTKTTKTAAPTTTTTTAAPTQPPAGDNDAGFLDIWKKD